jgi:hypothetical protein
MMKWPSDGGAERLPEGEAQEDRSIVGASLVTNLALPPGPLYDLVSDHIWNHMRDSRQSLRYLL